MSFGSTSSLPGANLDTEQMTALFDAFFRDNPQFFYLSRTYHLEGRSQAGDSNVIYDTLILQFTMEAEQRIYALSEMERVVQSILDSCPTDTDEYVRELYLHDRLAEICYEWKARGIELKRLQFVTGRAGAKPYLLLAEGVKGGKPSVDILPTLVNER